MVNYKRGIKSKIFCLNNSDVLVWIYLIITVILGLAVIQGDTTLGNDVIRNILLIIRVVCLGISFILLFISHKVEISLALFIPIIYFGISNLNSYIQSIDNSLGCLFLLGFLLLNQSSKKKLFTYYRKYLVLMAALGIIAFVCYIFLPVIPYRICDYYTSYVDHIKLQYVDYGFSYLYRESTGIVRLCGLFNEPGFFGTILALVLCADRLDFKKNDNKILLVAGILTFSLAFFLLLLIYFIFLSRKKQLFLFVLLILAGIYFFVLPNMTFENVTIANLVRRITFQNGNLVGDNRSNTYINYTLQNLMHSSDAWFGYGRGYSSQNFSHVLTYKTYLIDYGIIGFSLLYGFLAFVALKYSKKNWYAITFCICFFVSVYQRPSIFMLPYFVILFGGIEYILNPVEEKI